MLKVYLEKLIAGKNLTKDESHDALIHIMNGAHSSSIAAFLALLSAKGESREEVLGILEAMRKKMVPVRAGTDLLDIVGTGGDGTNTVNISTGASIVAASMGIKVAKHGNRSSSSLCGSADVLEALGVELTNDPAKVINSIEKVGIGFMFAPYFHPATKQIVAIRKEMRIRTIFNLIGPLLNPASVDHYMIGVYDSSLLEYFSSILSKMPIKRALIFHGSGTDEISCLGETKVLELDGKGNKKTMLIRPEEYGLQKRTLDELKGGSVKKNVMLLIEALSGKHPAIGETLALNAGVALYVMGKVLTISEGVDKALKHVRDGHAIKRLQQWIS